jgi:hypothetical protein
VTIIDSLAARNSGALQLAEPVSFAVLAEPQLLRRARRKLLPGVDAGAEGEFWLSELAETRGPDGLVLQPGVARMLREESASALR